jgi:hypothetical protein
MAGCAGRADTDRGGKVRTDGNGCGRRLRRHSLSVQRRRRFLWHSGLKACATNRGRAHHVRSRTSGSKRCRWRLNF